MPEPAELNFRDHLRGHKRCDCVELLQKNHRLLRKLPRETENIWIDHISQRFGHFLAFACPPSVSENFFW